MEGNERSKTGFRVRLSLRARLGLVLAAVALVPLVLFMVINQIDWRQSLRERADEALSNAARFNALKVDSLLAASLSMVEAASGLRDFEDFLAGDGDAPVDFDTVLETLHRVGDDDRIFIVSVALMDRSGWTVADTRRWGIGRDHSKRPSFKNAMLSGLPGVQIESPAGSRSGNELSFSAPIFGGGRFLGVIRINYSLAVIRHAIISGFGMAGPSSFPIILDENGHVLATALSDKGQGPQAWEEALDGLGARGTVSISGEHGRKRAWMGASAPLEQNAWRMFYLQEEAFFFAPIDRQFRISLLICAGLLILVFALSWFTAWRFTAPLYLLKNAAERIAAGDWSIRIRGSGSPEIAALENAFVQMAENLQARERDLIDAKSKAEAADRAKSDFLAVMSHEVRTPLNSIIGFGDLLLDDEAVGPAQREHLMKMEAGARHLLIMINEILDFSRIEAGRMKVVGERVNLEELLCDVVQVCGNAPWDDGLELFFQIGRAVPHEFMGDLQALTRILSNLVTNGIKFTEDGGVAIEVQLESSNGRPELQFSVSDTGPGLPPDSGEELFAPFTQADASSRRRHGGTGLGLAICKRLIDALGGRIWIDRSYRGGARFVFRVPVEESLSSLYVPAAGFAGKLQMPLLTKSQFFAEQMGLLLRSYGIGLQQIDPDDPQAPDPPPPVLLVHWNDALAGSEAGRAIRRGDYAPGTARVVVLLQPTLPRSRLPEVLRAAVVYNNPVFPWELAAGIRRVVEVL